MSFKHLPLLQFALGEAPSVAGEHVESGPGRWQAGLS